MPLSAPEYRSFPARENPMPRTSAVSLGGNPPSTARETTIWLLDHGLWPVLIRPGKKAPIGRNWGLKPPSRDELEAGFRRTPQAGVGLLLGPQSRVVDLEVDDPTGAEPALTRLFPDGLPTTAGWDSARGSHWLFLWDPMLAQLASVITFADGALELRAGGEGKQVMSICPPTKGTDGVSRRWTNAGGIAPLPEELMRCLRKRVSHPRRFRCRIPNGSASAVLEREAIRVRGAPVGQRNATLNRAAFVVGLQVGRSSIDRMQAVSVLRGAAEECGLSTSEAVGTISRGLDAGVARALVARA